MNFRIYVFMALCLLSFGQAIAETELEEELTRMRKSIALAKQEPTRENLLAMGKFAAWAKEIRPKPEYEREWKQLLHQAMAIPGHAQVFVDELELRRELYGKPDEPRVAYFDSMRWCLLFRHLAVYQSPEAVKALGGLLHDFRDTVPEEDRMVTGVVEENAYNAACALSLLGLRDPPLEPLLFAAALKYGSDYEGVFTRVQSWWEKVESGQIPFSFKGQSVEYRFKSDGTWETIPIANPPDDTPQIPEAKPPAERTVTQQAKKPPPDIADKANRSYILAALAALFALAAVWFGFGRTKARA
jgi:hypothetical protein